MALLPHYVQQSGAPAITATGFGLFACDCGHSLLIAGYEARNFLGIAIQCAACGKVSQTPPLPDGALPPNSATIVERGAENSSHVESGTVLVSREEASRLAAFYRPRQTDSDLHEVSDALLDDIEFQQSRHTDTGLDPYPDGYKSQALAWAVAHFRARLRDPDWKIGRAHV